MNKTKTAYGISGLLVAVGLVGFASADAPPTKGRIPDDAFVGSSIQLDRVPDYVPALARDGQIAGYVRKTELFADEGRAGHAPIMVLDESLSNPIGRMVPGRGFVPFGKPEESVPGFEVEVHSESVKDRR